MNKTILDSVCEWIAVHLPMRIQYYATVNILTGLMSYTDEAKFKKEVETITVIEALQRLKIFGGHVWRT